jgi:hypothetical protein
LDIATIADVAPKEQKDITTGVSSALGTKKQEGPKGDTSVIDKQAL